MAESDAQQRIARLREALEYVRDLDPQSVGIGGELFDSYGGYSDEIRRYADQALATDDALAGDEPSPR